MQRGMGRTQNVSNLPKATQITAEVGSGSVSLASPISSLISETGFYFGILSENIQGFFGFFF